MIAESYSFPLGSLLIRNSLSTRLERYICPLFPNTWILKLQIPRASREASSLTMPAELDNAPSTPQEGTKVQKLHTRCVPSIERLVEALQTLVGEGTFKIEASSPTLYVY